MTTTAEYNRAYFQRNKERLHLRRRKRVIEDYLQNGPAELEQVTQRLRELDDIERQERHA